MRHARSLRNGKTYAEFVDEEVVVHSQDAISQRQIMPTKAVSSFALGPLSNRPPQYQNQYMLVNENGWLRLSAVSRRALALPPEILAEIFYFCLSFHDGLPNIPDPNDAPLVLCAVCRQWRNVALTTPHLWSSICFDPELDLDPDDSESGTLYVDLWRMWLSRAQSTPLSIHLDIYMPEAVSKSLLELVCGLSHQWQDIDYGETVSLLSLPIDGKYPLLEKLRISPLPYHPILCFHDAPRLCDVYIPIYTTRIQLPWLQLTTFRTDSIGIEDCLELLGHALNLVDAHLEIHTHSSPTLPSTIFSLSQLRSLDLSGSISAEETMPMNLLRCLKTPALETLILGPEYYDRSVCDISPFLSFASQSSFQLHTLKLSLVHTTADALVQCLKATPSVIQLELRVSYRVSDTNTLFAQFTGHRDFLPKLERLRIGLPFGSIPDVSRVIGVLIWRCMTVAVARLQSFWFNVQVGPSYNRPALAAYIQVIKAHPVYLELKASGMELCVE
ncbi:hypothetical protein B0H12DRAFT_1164769 [Mycena haematopus]|nr:hypothetical protein B0H12DRAFT_1164769 [Mycena haematopus]